MRGGPLSTSMRPDQRETGMSTILIISATQLPSTPKMGDYGAILEGLVASFTVPGPRLSLPARPTRPVSRLRRRRLHRIILVYLAGHPKVTESLWQNVTGAEFKAHFEHLLSSTEIMQAARQFSRLVTLMEEYILQLGMHRDLEYYTCIVFYSDIYSL